MEWGMRIEEIKNKDCVRIDGRYLELGGRMGISILLYIIVCILG